MSSSATTEAADGVAVPQRYWAVATLALAVAMSTLDSAIANLALPTIAADVHATPAQSIWVVNAYQLAISVSLLPCASLGEIVGFQRVYQFGLAMFTAASLGCALSDSLLTLTLARIMQGFGAAGIMGVNIALLRFVYPHRQLGRGVGINALVVAVSSAVGPTIAAGILAVAPWPYLFAVNVPIGVLALAIGARSLPKTRRAPHPFDLPSAALNALALGLLIVAIDGVAHHEPAWSIALEAAGALCFGTFLVRRQLGLPAPLLPLDLLRIPIFALSVTTSIASFMAQSLALISLPFYFEEALHRSEVTTGLLMTPFPLGVGVMATISGRLADRYPAGLLGLIGLGVMSAGLFLLAAAPSDPTDLNLAWRIAICGIGFGFFQAPNNRALVTAAPRHRSGGASGMQSTARLLGQTIGAALVALIFSIAPHSGSLVTIVVAGAIAAAAALISSLRLMAPVVD